MIFEATKTDHVPPETTAFKLTLEPLKVTVNAIFVVDPLISVVEKSVYPAVELFHTDLTVPALLAPADSVTQ